MKYNHITSQIQLKHIKYNHNKSNTIETYQIQS